MEYDAGGFTITSAGLLTYVGLYGVFLMNGISDAQVNKPSYVTYASYVNGELYSSTVHQFAASSKAESLATTAIVERVTAQPHPTSNHLLPKNSFTDCSFTVAAM